MTSAQTDLTGATRYSCAVCGKVVLVDAAHETPQRTCEHEHAGILADCRATLTGKAKVA